MSLESQDGAKLERVAGEAKDIGLPVLDPRKS